MASENNHGGVRKGAGRPKGTTGAYKEEKRDKSIHIRISQKELDLISECSDKLNTTRANTIIKAIEELHKKLNK